MESGNDIRLDGRRVALTGATGFLGARVLAALIGAGAEVRALVRSGRTAIDLWPTGVEAVNVALTDGASLARALDGVDALVHLAYDVRASAEANGAAFDTLLAAADGRVGRIVHASSVVVYDGWPDADLDETQTMTRPGGSPYRRAKIAMEEKLIAGSLPAAILQPTIVYGPRSALWTDQLAGALKSGGVVLPDPEGRCNAVYVDDVAQAVMRALVLEDLGRERFLISGAAPAAWSDLLRGYCDALGGGTILREPAETLRAALGPEPGETGGPSLAARISGAGRRVLGNDRFEAAVSLARSALKGGGAAPLRPDHHLFGVFTGTGAVRIDHARARLGYDPAFDLAAGLAATTPHLREKFGTSAD